MKDLTKSLPVGNGQYATRPITAITDIVIHHTASSIDTTPEEVARWHIDRGWPGIGYHYLIASDGTVYQTQPNEIVSNHNENRNTFSLGVALIGNFEEAPPTKPQMRSLKKLLAKLLRQLPSIAQIKRHGDYKSTSCPGKLLDVESAVKGAKMRNFWRVALPILAIVIGVSYYLYQKK